MEKQTLSYLKKRINLIYMELNVYKKLILKNPVGFKPSCRYLGAWLLNGELLVFCGTKSEN